MYNEKEARDLVTVLLKAVKYCHDRGIVHRDLKVAVECSKPCLCFILGVLLLLKSVWLNVHTRYSTAPVSRSCGAILAVKAPSIRWSGLVSVPSLVNFPYKPRIFYGVISPMVCRAHQWASHHRLIRRLILLCHSRCDSRDVDDALCETWILDATHPDRGRYRESSQRTFFW